MASRLSRRLAAFLCAGLLALTVLVGSVVTLPLGLAGSADYPPGPSRAGIIMPGAIAGIIIHDGIIVND